jgi:hypothetical protein
MNLVIFGLTLDASWGQLISFAIRNCQRTFDNPITKTYNVGQVAGLE